MKKHQATIVDIAKALNISKSTVSRALTGHPEVKPATRAAILALAEQMDYYRNMHSIGLIKKSSHTIGMIVPELISSFFPLAIIGAQEAAAKAGYNLIISHSNESYETEVANTKSMLDSQVDGLIVSISKDTRNFDHFRVFERKGIPLVFFNRVCDDMQVSKVVVDDYDGAFRIVEHLIRQGRTRIAHLSGPANLLICEKRLAGYKAAHRKYKLPIHEDLIVSYDLSIPKVSIYVKHLLSLNPIPDAIFAINDPTAIEAIQTIRKQGLHIPKDIAVVGFSDDYMAALIDPPLTTVSQPIKEIGQTAVEILIDQMNKDPSGWKVYTKVLKTQLIVRQSG